MANVEPETNPVPFANEANPGLGRNAGLLEEQRRQSGELPDDPADNPVQNKESFRVTPTR